MTIATPDAQPPPVGKDRTAARYRRRMAPRRCAGPDCRSRKRTWPRKKPKGQPPARSTPSARFLVTGTKTRDPEKVSRTFTLAVTAFNAARSSLQDPRHSRACPPGTDRQPHQVGTSRGTANFNHSRPGHQPLDPLRSTPNVGVFVDGVPIWASHTAACVRLFRPPILSKSWGPAGVCRPQRDGRRGGDSHGTRQPGFPRQVRARRLMAGGRRRARRR